MSKTNLKNDHNIFVGVITSVNGVKGHVKIRSFTNQPSDIGGFQTVFDENNNEYLMKMVTLKKDYVIAGITGVHSREEAEKLRNTKLFIKRSELPAVNQGEFYHTDLVGCEVFLKDGTRFGVVKNMVNFGAGDIMEIYDYNSEKAIYYPFNKQFVDSIDVNNKVVTLELLEEVIAASE